MENYESPFIELKRIGGAGEENGNPFFRQGRRGDDVVEMLHEHALCKNWKALRKAGTDIYAVFPDDMRIVWRPVVYVSDELPKFS